MQAGYYQSAWSDIKNSPNWFGKLCLLALISIIPVFGPIVVGGYALGWARDIAWNIHAPMPERIFGNQDGKLYSRGFFAIIIGLIFAIPAIIVYGIYASAAAGDVNRLLVMLLGMLSLACSIAGMFFSWVGDMRMSIYGRLSPGLQVKQIWKMMKHDMGGLGRIFGMVLLVGFIVGMVVSFVLGFVLFISGAGMAMQLAGSGIDASSLSTNPQTLMALAPSLGILSVFGIVIGYFAQVASMFISVLSYRALGYWTRQFEVPAWGGQDAPLPFETRADSAAAYAAAQPQPGYQQPGAAGYSATQPVYQQPGMASSQAADPTYQQPGTSYATYGAQQGQQAPQAYGQPGQSYAAPQAGQQAPEWIAQANAMAPQPQEDPYTTGVAQAQPVMSAQPAPVGQPFAEAQPVQAQPFSQAPAQAQPLVSEDMQAPQATSPAATTVAATAAAPATSPQPATADMHHKLEARPAPRWEKIDLGEQSSVQAATEAPAASAPQAGTAAATSSATADLSQPASGDMHHKMQAKPAPHWEKIDLDSL